MILDLSYQDQLTILSVLWKHIPFINNCGMPTMCITLSTFHVEIL